jgi:hypothetical protein
MCFYLDRKKAGIQPEDCILGQLLASDLPEQDEAKIQRRHKDGI